MRPDHVANAVTAPMFRATTAGVGAGRLFGMTSAQSYRAGAFDDNVVRAIEWLADLVARVLTQEDGDRQALRRLPAGDTSGAVTSNHVVEFLNSRVDGGPEQRSLSLTPAEQEVALRLTNGLDNDRMAAEPGRSPNTIKAHLRGIFRKHGTTSRLLVAADVRGHLVG
ncbi:helix-turn-helix domain-containing protein [Actinosynnema mirum]|uniref:helix-turn-helix domain-containing protein n=1 Tax=Actinosynnema mirum TaxID=40567 RepID=UPI001180599B|nr:LuxR C-terminal-related transcriptional regulator [Actinosynnema mirum]